MADRCTWDSRGPFTWRKGSPGVTHCPSHLAITLVGEQGKQPHFTVEEKPQGSKWEGDVISTSAATVTPTVSPLGLGPRDPDWLITIGALKPQ